MHICIVFAPKVGLCLHRINVLCWENLFFSVCWSGVKDTTINAAKINNAVSWAVNLEKPLKHHNMSHSSAHSLRTHVSLFWISRSPGFRYVGMCRAGARIMQLLIYQAAGWFMKFVRELPKSELLSWKLEKCIHYTLKHYPSQSHCEVWKQHQVADDIRMMERCGN